MQPVIHKFYVDGSYSHKWGVGAFCIVSIINDDKSYEVFDWDNVDSGTDPEVDGLAFTIARAIKYRDKDVRCVVYTDSMAAIRCHKEYAADFGIQLQHIKGHLLGRDDVVINDHVKAHDWCDVMARLRVNDNIRKVIAIAEDLYG